jgi:hypothetical protein
VRTIDLTDDDLAAVAAAIRRAVKEDKFPRAPRLDPLRPALAQLEKAKSAEPAIPQPKAPRRPTALAPGPADLAGPR